MKELPPNRLVAASTAITSLNGVMVSVKHSPCWSPMSKEVLPVPLSRSEKAMERLIRCIAASTHS